MYSLKRGDVVRVKVYGGSEVTLLVWGHSRGKVLVTNDEEFRKLLAGKPALWPVAFPLEDVRLHLDAQDSGTRV